MSEGVHMLMRHVVGVMGWKKSDPLKDEAVDE